MPQDRGRKPDAKLNVVVISAWYPNPRSPMSGVFVRDHARAAALHHRVVVIVPEPAVGGRPLVLQRDDDELPTIRVRYRPSRIPLLTAIRFTRGVLSGLRSLERAGLRAELIHAHVHDVGPAAILAGWVYRVPVVLSEHSSGFSLGSISRLRRWRARFVFRAVDLVCPVSEDLRLRMERLGLHARYRVVPNAVDTELFTPAPPPSDDGPARALFVGGLDPIKRVDLLLRALARLRRHDIRLEVVGTGVAGPSLQALARDLGIAEIVEFTGYLGKEAVAERMRAAHFLVLPSMIETFGLVLVEALSVGRPVVAVQTGAIPEIVNDRCGIVAPADGELGLAQAIGQMIEDHARFDWRELATSAQGRFGLRVVGDRWDAIYRSLC